MASVKILINSESNIILFRRMNQSLVDGYKQQGFTPNMGQHKAMFESTHMVKLESGQSYNFWKYMIFPSEQAYTMAVLKWL